MVVEQQVGGEMWVRRSPRGPARWWRRCMGCWNWCLGSCRLLGHWEGDLMAVIEMDDRQMQKVRKVVSNKAGVQR